jgi:hypothetical protein
LAAPAVLLLSARVAFADPLQFLSEATLTQVYSHSNDSIREGSGEATYLGSFTEVNDITRHCDGYQGVATLTNADGDSLVLAREHEPVGPPGQATDYVGTYQIIGGTGQFANATGSGTMTVHGNADGTTDQVFDGTISFGTRRRAAGPLGPPPGAAGRTWTFPGSPD